jgi:prephenate dehydratase
MSMFSEESKPIYTATFETYFYVDVGTSPGNPKSGK